MMKRIAFFLFLFLVALSLHAQTLYILPATTSGAPRIVPVGATPTFWTQVNGTNDKGIVWTSSGGTLVDGDNTTSHVCTGNGNCTEGITSATTTGVISITATSHANGAVSKTAYVQFVASPTAVTTSPHLLITQAMLAGLQAKATAGNPNYQAVKNAAIGYYNTANSVWSWTCNSGTGQPSSAQYNIYDAIWIQFFAFMQMMEPYPSSQTTYNWGCYAHDTALYYMAHSVSGDIYWGPGNDWSNVSENASLFIDWCLGAGALSKTTDGAAIRAFIMHVMPIIAQNGNGLVVGTSGLNTYTQFDGGGQYDIAGQRATGNNYTFSRDLLEVAWALTLPDNTTDDPNIPTGTNNTCGATRYQICSDYTAGSLHAYWNFWLGSLGLKTYAHLEDTSIVKQLYTAAYPSGGFNPLPKCNYTNFVKYDCFGDGINGESSEGSWYQYSVYRLAYAMADIQTAGYDDPVTWGPQINILHSHWMDTHVMADFEFLSDFSTNGSPGIPAHTFWSTGDGNTYYKSVADMATEGVLSVIDSYTGETYRNQAETWLVLNTAFGGPDGNEVPAYGGTCTSACGYYNNIASDYGRALEIPFFISQPAVNLTTSPPASPCTNYPLSNFNNSYNQHQEIKTGCTTSDATINVYGANSLINHEHNFNGFDIYSKSEYIIKGRTEFDDYNDEMSMEQFRNGAAYLTSSPTANCSAPNTYAPGDGGMFSQQTELVPFIPVTHSEMPTYDAFFQSDGPSYGSSYGCSPGASDITNASRDNLFVPGINTMFVYDRATTASALGKAVFINPTGAPTITGNSATWSTRSGTQKGHYQALLPVGGSLSTVKLINSLTLSAPFANLNNASSMTVTCTRNYADGSTSNCNGAGVATWANSTPSVCSVSSTGVVTAATSGVSTGVCAFQVAVHQFESTVGFSSPATNGINLISGASSGTFGSIPDLNQLSDWEPYTSLKWDAGAVTQANFLTAVDWGSSSYTPTTATLVQSSAGDGLDCGVKGTMAACFLRTVGTFSGTTYPASGATTQYVADLTPNTSYTISGAGAPTSATSDSAGVLSFSAAGTGSITVGALIPPAIAAFGGGVLSGGGIQ